MTYILWQCCPDLLKICPEIAMCDYYALRLTGGTGSVLQEGDILRFALESCDCTAHFGDYRLEGDGAVIAPALDERGELFGDCRRRNAKCGLAIGDYPGQPLGTRVAA